MAGPWQMMAASIIYLIDISLTNLGEYMDKHPSVMWRHFIKALPLTLVAMLLTAVTVLAVST